MTMPLGGVKVCSSAQHRRLALEQGRGDFDLDLPQRLLGLRARIILPRACHGAADDEGQHRDREK
jgi:hypothetical protein